MKNRIPLILSVLTLLCSCELPSSPLPKKVEARVTDAAVGAPISANKDIFTAKEIIARKQVPVLCYHRIRAFKSTDSRSMKDYIVPVEAFR